MNIINNIRNTQDNNNATPKFELQNMIYQLEDGRFWSTKEACFVDQQFAEEWLKKFDIVDYPKSPKDKLGFHSLEGLHDALNYYQLPLGELASVEERFASLRNLRDKKLSETDFMLMPDYPINEDALERLKAYRQALRDLPQLQGAPWDGGGLKTPWPENS